MFNRLGRFVYRRRWFVLAVWLVLIAASLPLAPRVTQSLRVGGFADPSLESSRAAAKLARDLGYSTSTVIVVFESADKTLRADDPRFVAQTQTALAGLARLSVPTDVVPYTANPRQVSTDGYTAFAVINLRTDTEAAAKLMPQITAALQPPPGLRMIVGGGPAFYADVERVSQEDLARAEAVAFPIAIVALLLVFGSVLAAGLPVLAGGAAVLVILAVLALLGRALELSIFTVNLATLLGLGLGLDYSLFLASRFREEIAAGAQKAEGRRQEAENAALVEDAVARTLATAGQAVAFSGLTVLIGLSALLLFRINLLRSIGVGGVIVVFVSVIAALTLLPALLSFAGARIDALSLRRLLRRPTPDAGLSPEDSPWHRLAHLVMRRPLTVFLATLGLLLLLGIPFLAVRFSSPDASIMPPSAQSRQVYDVLRRDFDANETDPVLAVVTATNGEPVTSPANLAYLYDFARSVAADPRVARVDSIVTADPRLTLPQYQAYYANLDAVRDPYLSRFVRTYARGGTTLLAIVSKYPSNGPQTRLLVQKLRNSTIGNGLTLEVTGGAAGVIDTVNGLYRQFPVALLFIVLTTYLVLLALFRSVFIPLKAVIMNALSIVASYGALVWVFQDGNLSRLLNFTPLGFIEPTLPIIMFCTLFGLSMDYEVFLLSRIKERYEETGDNTESVAVGIERSARIITSAALIVVLVALSFVTADIVLVKALGLGVAVAVAVDATIVRALLVPATMRLLGHWNWYAPRWLLRLLPQRLLTEAGGGPQPVDRGRADTLQGDFLPQRPRGHRGEKVQR